MQKSTFFRKNWKRKLRKNICLWMSIDKYIVNFSCELFQISGFISMVLIVKSFFYIQHEDKQRD
jgi:hypothetical protein